MTLQEEFEKANYKRPGEPFSESIKPEYRCHVLKWCENYIDFLEKKVNDQQKEVDGFLFILKNQGIIHE